MGQGLRRGSLPWPVSRGKIVSRFGVQQNPALHTVTQNNGIDIDVPSGTYVDAVADGEVSTIWWLPSFGNLPTATRPLPGWCDGTDRPV